MKKNLILLLVLFLSTSFAFSQTSISGKVTVAETGEEIIAANIIVSQNGNFVQGETTDIDGNYSIRVAPGTYDLAFSYTGFASQKITNIIANPGKNTHVNVRLTSGVQLDEVVVTGYKAPLIKQDATSTGGTVTSEQIRNLPTRNMNLVAAATAGASTSDEGASVRIKGSRSNAKDYYIDGIRVGKKSKSQSKKKPKKEQPKPINNSNEEYNHFVENEFLTSSNKPLSTFSIDVDNASYSNARRYLNNYQMPPKDAVRIEEFINYFDYDYPQPNSVDPFSINTEISDCPWNSENKLVHIGLQGYELPKEQMPPSNLVFLLDVSGSMSAQNKLPLLRKAFKLLVQQLRQEDKVSIVVYAGASGLVLPPTSGSDKHKIISALDNLRSSGSTAGAAGIQLAYKTAESTFIKNGNNRIILATDGDFNVGTSGNAALVKLIEEKRKSGVSLSILGFGMGNYKDGKMEQIADNGNGNYAYIDNFEEAKKVFVQEMGGTLHTIAKDVKLQIEFNQNYIKEYRLIGYVNRKLKDEDFANDKKDAGDLGAGHTVTALYEIVPTRASAKKNFLTRVFRKSNQSEENWMTVKLRYKKPDGKKSKLLEVKATNKNVALSAASDNFRFSAAVASFGMLLRDSKFKGDADYDKVLKMAQVSLGKDEFGYRNEFLELVKKAKETNTRLTAKK
ncbi:MAG: Ca-activated chloride channel family protein [Granulosicoccus sp.]|jgi:Ca-activated chloride channel family protein